MPEKLPKGWVKTTLGEIRLDTSVGISQQQMHGETFELYSVPSFDTRKPEIVLGDTIGSNKVLVTQRMQIIPNSNTPQTLMREILSDLGEAIKEFAAAEEEVRRD